MIISGFDWITCLVYLYDVIVFSNSIEKPLQHVAEIVRIMQSAKGPLKLSKFKHFRTLVTYLRLVVTHRQLEIESYNIKTLKEAFPLQTKTRNTLFPRIVQCLSLLRSSLCKDSGSSERNVTKSNLQNFRQPHTATISCVPYTYQKFD